MANLRNELPTAIDKISLKAWFTNLLNSEPRLKAHHFEVIKAYFYGLGLSDYEEVHKYEKALKLYFGK
jgi:hypothetical protein